MMGSDFVMMKDQKQSKIMDPMGDGDFEEDNTSVLVRWSHHFVQSNSDGKTYLSNDTAESSDDSKEVIGSEVLGSGKASRHINCGCQEEKLLNKEGVGENDDSGNKVGGNSDGDAHSKKQNHVRVKLHHVLTQPLRIVLSLLTKRLITCHCGDSKNFQKG